MNIVELKNLNLGFMTEVGYRQALFDVSLKLKSGEIHALVGESGCGKSITAMSILRLLPKNALIKSGEIIFDNKNILELSDAEMRTLRGAKIALIPQDPMTSLNPLYTIGNQITEAIHCHKKISKDEAKKLALEALDSVRIPDAKNRFNLYPHELSGGMKQRVVIATSLTLNANVIIADEPTTALDVTIQSQIMSLLREFFANPSHPYSVALLNSLPNKDRNSKLESIKGAPPSIYEDIEGCRFYPRCEHCIKNTCNKEVPQEKEIAPFHTVNCWLY